MFGVNPREILGNLDAEVGRRLTRAQCLEIIDAPPRVRLLSLAEKYNVRLVLIQHVRYKCKWMRTSSTRGSL